MVVRSLEILNELVPHDVQDISDGARHDSKVTDSMMIERCNDGVDFGLDPKTMWDESRKVETLKAGVIDLVLRVTDVPLDGEPVGFFSRSDEGEDGARHGGESICK